MSDDIIRKRDSLGTSAALLHSEFKNTQSRYNDLVSELALLTKSELRPIINSLKENNDINGMRSKANKVFENIENVLFDMDDTNMTLDEIVQTVGGLEFSTDNTVDKMAKLLRDQENQQARMTKEINLIKESFNQSAENGEITLEEVLEDIEEFLIEFSRFQDYVQDSIPRVSKLFDTLDEEEERGIKFGKTNKI